MGTVTVIVTIALSMSLLIGCTSAQDRVPANRYTTSEQERAVVKEMNLHRPARTVQAAASAEDKAAVRESMVGRSIRSETSQSGAGTISEMSGGKLLRPGAFAEPKPGTVEQGD